MLLFGFKKKKDKAFYQHFWAVPGVGAEWKVTSGGFSNLLNKTKHKEILKKSFKGNWQTHRGSGRKFQVENLV